MMQSGKSPNLILDDQLAEFTDQALAGKTSQVEANVDEELLALEETILRLKKAFPPATLDQSTAKQMHVRFNARVKREAQKNKHPFWKKLFEPQPRLQFALAFTAIAVTVAFAVFAPFSTAGMLVPAAALNPARAGIAIVGLTAVLLAVLWARRHK